MCIINTFAYIYINTIGQVEEDIKKIYDQAKWFLDFAKGNPTTDTICRLIEVFCPP